MDGGASRSWSWVLHLGKVRYYSHSTIRCVQLTRIQRSVHNTRIERLWFDVTQGFGSKWKAFFMDLEHNHNLNAEVPAHLWLLHHLFVNAINEDAQEWAAAWNSHRLHVRGEPRCSPRELFFFGMVENGPRGLEDMVRQLEEEDIGEISEYGIDWQAMNDRVLMEHHNTHNADSMPPTLNGLHPFAPFSAPNQFSTVVCDDPDCPLTVEQCLALDSYLSTHFDLTLRDMGVRRYIWVAALEFCSLIT